MDLVAEADNTITRDLLGRGDVSIYDDFLNGVWSLADVGDGKIIHET